MTTSMVLVLVVLVVTLGLFVSEKLRADLVALVALCVLGLSGLVAPSDLLAGFSNPAVVTIWAMFILSAGLSATGVADLIGKQLLRLSGRGEPGVILAIMLVTGTLSGFMNNIGVAAMMLPVTMDIARRTGLAPSRLLMPMAFASLLGGMTTLVGTSLNLVASGTLRQAGLDGFSLFSFTPIGGPALVVGCLFVAFIGRHLLPREIPESFKVVRPGADGGWQFSHNLADRTFLLEISQGSPFDGSKLGETGLGPMLGFHVRTVERQGERLPVLGAGFVLRGGDILEVQGRREDFDEFRRWSALEVAQGREIAELLIPRRLVLATVTVAEGSEIEGLTVNEADFRRRFGAHVLAVAKGGRAVRDNLGSHQIQAGDSLHVEMGKEEFPALQDNPSFSQVEILGEDSFADAYPSSDTLLEMDIPKDSTLAGRSLGQTGLGDALGMRIMAIGRRPASVYFPDNDEVLHPGDKLLARGGPQSLHRMRGLQSLEPVSNGKDNGADRSPEEEFSEATLAPGSQLAGKTLRELDFRRRYGVQVLSIWRAGRAYRSHLRNLALEFGDAFLLSGSREALRALANDPDFLLLSKMSLAQREEAKDTRRAPLSAAIMVSVALLVMLDVLPVALAALSGATLMVLTRCLSIEAAHRAIEWKSVFLVACMLPMGTAMQETGAAALLAHGVLAATNPLGAWATLAALYLVTALGTIAIPAAAVVLIMANVAIDVAAEAGLPTHMVVMVVAMAAAASFTSPISHPSNVLVMGPGGYRFADYLRLGLLLALVVMLTVLPMIALVWSGNR